MSNVNCHLLLDSVRIAVEIMFSFKPFSAFKSSRLGGPSSFAWNFLSSLKSDEAFHAKMGTNFPRGLKSSKNERSSVTVVGTFSLRVVSAV